MRNATPEERLAALRMLRNEQRTGDSTPRSRNRFSQRLSRTFGSRPHSGAGTPRRNSGVLATAETPPSTETHPTTEMESTAEEPSTIEEASTAGLSRTADMPRVEEMPHVEEAHTAEAPHAAGSAHTVEVSRSSAEAPRSEESPPFDAAAAAAAAAAQNEPAEHSDMEALSVPATTTRHEASPAIASTSSETSDNVGAALETAPPAAPIPTAPTSSTGSGSPSEPNIAPFYSYR